LRRLRGRLSDRYRAKSAQEDAVRRVLFACVLLIASGASGPRAQSTSGTEFNPYFLEDSIVVTANGFATPLREIATSVTIITRDQIELSQATLALDVLREAPGVDIVRSGGEGQQVSLFLRGTNSYQALVLVDGVEVNDPSSPNNAANPAHMSASEIERIEILRGPQSVLYGSDAVGGVIQIFTRRGSGKPTVRASVEGGSFGTDRQVLAVEQGDERVDYSFGINRLKTDGISAAAEWRGNPEKDGYDNTGYTGTLGLRPADGLQLRLSGGRTRAMADLDKSSGVLDDPDYRLESRDHHFSARLSYVEPRGRWTGQVGAYVTHYERSTHDEVDAAHPDESERTHYQGRRLKFDWQNGVRLHPASQLTFGIETEQDRMEQDLHLVSGWGDYASLIDQVSARTTAAYVLEQVNLGGVLILGAGGRYDDHELFGDHSNFRVTGALVLDKCVSNTGIGLKLRGSYGSGFKAPSLAQLYDPSLGNIGLKPETSTGWEIGFDLRTGSDWVQIGATWFDNSFEDLIVYDPDTFRNLNIDAASSHGAELYAAVDYSGVSLRGDWTYTETEDEGTGRALLRRPEHKGSITVSKRFLEKLDVQTAVSYTGSRDDMDYAAWPAERVTLESYTVTNVTASYEIIPHARVYGRIENLFDRQYEEILTYGTPGRAVYVGVGVGR